MNSTQNNHPGGIEIFINNIIRWRWAVMFLTMIGVIAVASNIRFLEFSLDYKDIFKKGNPQLVAFETLQDNYNRSDNILIVLEPKSKNVFSKKVLTAIHELTKKAWKSPFSTRVDSITNFQHTTAQEDNLIVEDLVKDPQTLSTIDLDKVRAIALAEPLLVNRLVSPSGHVTGINITQEFPNKAPDEKPSSVTFVRKIVNKMKLAHPDINFHIVGMSPFNTAFMEASQADMKKLVPLMFLVIIISLGLLLRSFWGTLSSVFVFILSMAGAMGFAGIMGWKLTAVSASTPTVVLTMAVADCVHILASFLHYLRSGKDKIESIKESLRINLQPVFITSITTAIGFLSMNFSESPIFHAFGSMVAFGVIIAFILSVTFFPAFLSILPFKSRNDQEEKKMHLQGVSNFVVQKRVSILWVSLFLVLIFSALIPKNELNDQFTEYFDKSVPFRQASDFTNKNLGGTYNIDFSLNSGESDGVSKFIFQKKSDKFVSWLRLQPEVIHVNTITDTLKRLNKNMHGDDINWYRLPEGQQLSSQYLLLYEMSLPYGLDLTNQINLDKSAIRISATLKSLSTVKMLALEDRCTQWLNTHAPNIKFSAASPTLMFSHIGKENVKGMLLGTSLALVLISFILMLSLKSFKLGFISLAPNLVPAGVAFGAWGLLVGEVGMSLSVVSGMTLGIVVDDTVHFLSKYIRARREKNLTATEAVQYAFSTVGSAILTTSFVLVVGFSMLALSSFRMNYDMGIMTAMIITIALVFDFLFLPALLITIDKEKVIPKVAPVVEMS
jgi:predicted RND superfamily exporter protein